MPITISTQAVNINEEVMQEMTSNRDKYEEYTNNKVIYPRENNLESMMHFNIISSDYVNYIGSMDKDMVSAISYEYGTTLNVITKNSDGTYSMVPSWTNYSMASRAMTGERGGRL